VTSFDRLQPGVVRVLLQYLDGVHTPAVSRDEPAVPERIDLDSIRQFVSARPSKHAVLDLLHSIARTADRSGEVDFMLSADGVRQNGLALCAALEKKSGEGPFFESKQELEFWRAQLRQSNPPRLYACVPSDADLTPKIALFGTITSVAPGVENPRAPAKDSIKQLDWREMAFLDIANRVSATDGSPLFEDAVGPTKAVLYNPIVPADQWSPDNIKEETRQKDLAAIKTVCMDPTAAGPVSAFELWTSIAFSILRGTCTNVNVADLVTDAVHNLRVPAQDLINARRMLQVALDRIAPRLEGVLTVKPTPGDVFRESFDQLEAFRRRPRIDEAYLRPLPKPAGHLKAQIAIAGTVPEGSRLCGNDIARACVEAGVSREQVIDLHDDHWSVATHYARELDTKEESKVNCVFFSHENAMGSLADIGRAMLRALMNASYQIIVLPDLAEKKPGQPGSYYRSAYGVIREDWERLTAVCPQLRHYVKFVRMKPCGEADGPEVERVAREVAQLARDMLEPTTPRESPPGSSPKI
jgi:hypothetical protein